MAAIISTRRDGHWIFGFTNRENLAITGGNDLADHVSSGLQIGELVGAVRSRDDIAIAVHVDARRFEIEKYFDICQAGFAIVLEAVAIGVNEDDAANRG